MSCAFLVCACARCPGVLVLVQAGGMYQLHAERHGDDGDVCIGADCFR